MLCKCCQKLLCKQQNYWQIGWRMETKFYAAEMVALMIAQQNLGNYTLALPNGPGYELITSTEPCSQCFGALPWSGIQKMVCGARREDAEAVGFDEGPKPENWVEELNARGIEVVRDILRPQACQILKKYMEDGYKIYNG